MRIDAPDDRHFTFLLFEVKADSCGNIFAQRPVGREFASARGQKNQNVLVIFIVTGEQDKLASDEMAICRTRSSVTGFFHGKECVLVRPSVQLEADQLYLINFDFDVKMPQSHFYKYIQQERLCEMQVAAIAAVSVQNLFCVNKQFK